MFFICGIKSVIHFAQFWYHNMDFNESDLYLPHFTEIWCNIYSKYDYIAHT